MKIYLLPAILLLASQASAAYQMKTLYARCRCIDAKGNAVDSATQYVCQHSYDGAALINTSGTQCVVVTARYRIEGFLFAQRERIRAMGLVGDVAVVVVAAEGEWCGVRALSTRNATTAQVEQSAAAATVDAVTPRATHWTDVMERAPQLLHVVVPNPRLCKGILDITLVDIGNPVEALNPTERSPDDPRDFTIVQRGRERHDPEYAAQMVAWRHEVRTLEVRALELLVGIFSNIANGGKAVYITISAAQSHEPMGGSGREVRQLQPFLESLGLDVKRTDRELFRNLHANDNSNELLHTVLHATAISGMNLQGLKFRDQDLTSVGPLAFMLDVGLNERLRASFAGLESLSMAFGGDALESWQSEDRARWFRQLMEGADGLRELELSVSDPQGNGERPGWDFMMGLAPKLMMTTPLSILSIKGIAFSSEQFIEVLRAQASTLEALRLDRIALQPPGRWGTILQVLHEELALKGLDLERLCVCASDGGEGPRLMTAEESVTSTARTDRVSALTRGPVKELLARLLRDEQFSG
ncbi:hypothetical protein EJ03DRAFT_339720 [Teratosphaeria nubilosa]|uniref:Uncharacterized protein n=1 Tax=Teratosphaeria nubilosa TaxID=161662 RepID=A0A6G1KVV1_9PEZI|nr:hypothetical protein EJ03DRAFT_339720 [Teratosphaeria nubilosa]